MHWPLAHWLPAAQLEQAAWCVPPRCWPRDTSHGASALAQAARRGVVLATRVPVHPVFLVPVLNCPAGQLVQDEPQPEVV